jgi:hypothetical protein
MCSLETYCPATDGRSRHRIEEEVRDGRRLRGVDRFPAEELLLPANARRDVAELEARLGSGGPVETAAAQHG